MTNPLHKIRLESTRPNIIVTNRRQKWARALRSHDYLRGQGRLCDVNNAFCPLGVALDVFEKEMKPAIGWQKYDKGWDFNGSKFFLTDAAVEFYGMNRWGAFYIPNDNNVHTIPEMNDVRNWPFEQTADLLEDPRVVWIP